MPPTPGTVVAVEYSLYRGALTAYSTTCVEEHCTSPVEAVAKVGHGYFVLVTAGDAPEFRRLWEREQEERAAQS